MDVHGRRVSRRDISGCRVRGGGEPVVGESLSAAVEHACLVHALPLFTQHSVHTLRERRIWFRLLVSYRQILCTSRSLAFQKAVGFTIITSSTSQTSCKLDCTSEPVGKQASKHAGRRSKQASQQASKQASKPASTEQASQQACNHLSKEASLGSQQASRGPGPQEFRLAKVT